MNLCIVLVLNKQWIPAKYTNWDNAKVGQRVNVAVPSNNAISNRQNYAGSVRVNYQGRGQVRLVNNQGAYVSQYVPKNSTWRAWEKATINNEPMYRIGTQNQWVPAKYVASVQTTVKKSAPAVHVTATPAKTQTSQITKPAVPVVNHNTTSTDKQQLQL